MSLNISLLVRFDDLKLVLFFAVLVCMIYHFSDVRSFFTMQISMLISLKFLRVEISYRNIRYNTVVTLYNFKTKI